MIEKVKDSTLDWRVNGYDKSVIIKSTISHNKITPILFQNPISNSIFSFSIFFKGLKMFCIKFLIEIPPYKLIF